MLFKKKELLVGILFTLLIISSCGHLKEAKTSYSSGNYEKTIQLCNNALKENPDDTQAMLLLSQSYRAFNKPEKALKIINKAVTIKTTNSALKKELGLVHMSYGDQYAGKKEYSHALSHYRSAENEIPKNRELIKKTAELYLKTGYLDKANNSYVTLYSLSKDSALVKDKFREIKQRTRQAQSFFDKGKKAWDKNHLKTALSHFRKAVKSKSDHKDAQYYSYLSEGRLLVKQGAKNSLWDAIELFGKAVNIYDQSPEPHYWMGMAYEKKDDEIVNAIDSFEKVIELDPDGPLAEASKKKLSELKKRKEKLDKFWGK